MRVYERAQGSGVIIRIIGGVAIAMRCPSAAAGPLARPYADLDLAGYARDRREITRVLSESGYQPDEAFNAINGARRLFFWDSAHERQADVFLDQFEMCHRLDLRPRLAMPGPTVPLADLLLMKLQIIESNEKDLRDIITLLVDHDFGDSDSSHINVSYLSRLVAQDWGLWRTVTMVAARADQYAREVPNFSHCGRVHAQVQQFLAAVEEVPKTRKWKLRARLGDHKQWYLLPEESE